MFCFLCQCVKLLAIIDMWTKLATSCVQARLPVEGLEQQHSQTTFVLQSVLHMGYMGEVKGDAEIFGSV